MNLFDVEKTKEIIDYGINKISELITGNQGMMTKVPDDREVMIVFSDMAKGSLTIHTTDTTQVLYNKDFLYINNEENDNVQIIPMAQIDTIMDSKYDYSKEDDSDLPFTMGGE